VLARPNAAHRRRQVALPVQQHQSAPVVALTVADEPAGVAISAPQGLAACDVEVEVLRVLIGTEVREDSGRPVFALNVCGD
jgi:hypothetical protein